MQNALVIIHKFHGLKMNAYKVPNSCCWGCHHAENCDGIKSVSVLQYVGVTIASLESKQESW